MNDIFNPTGLDLTKNLHGHVRVETRSRWTGKVIDSQEKDNLITNAIQKFAYTNLWTNNNMQFYFAPIYAKALGGLMLFDGTLTESADNIWLPNNAKLVGLAAQTADTSSTLWGSYNGTESTLTSSGFTTVWDFLTSQANGTIASLSRTSYSISASAPGHTSVTVSPAIGQTDTGGVITNLAYLGYDYTNKYIYITPNSSTVIDGVTYSSSGIYRAKFDYEKVSFFNGMPPVSRWTLIKTLTSSDGTSVAAYYAYDPYDNCFYYTTSSNTLHIIAMDGTHTTKSLPASTGSSGRVVASENYYWRLYGANAYRITKTNTSDYVAYTLPEDVAYMAFYENDIIFAGKYGNYYPYLVYPDGTCIKVGSIGASSSYTGDYIPLGLSYAFRRWGSYSSSPCLRSWYLGTIANLDSPVTKSSSQTMKITYTLTEA